jgi:hypothetical protein
MKEAPVTTTNDDDNFITLPDGRKIVRDGGKVTVKMTLMDNATVADAALHRPGYRTVTDAKISDGRHVAYAGMVHDLATAWRNPAADAEPPPAKPTGDARDRAHDAMCLDLANAWRAA